MVSNMASLLEGISSIDEFLTKLDVYHNDIQSFHDLQMEIRKGTFSLSDPLGCLLELMKFSHNKNARDVFNEIVLDDEKHSGNRYDAAASLRRLRLVSKKYGIDIKSPVSDYQGISCEGFDAFVSAWLDAQTGDPVWNPGYAPETKLPEAVIEYAGTHSPLETVREFNIRRYVKYDWSKQMIEGRDIFVPFNGFQMARCMELSYRGKNQ